MDKITRKEILDLAKKYNMSHVSSAFSIVEIINTVYDHKREHDEFILSKGHGCLALYAMLYNLGYNPEMCGHPDIDEENGIMCTTGSLGHGLPIALGKAIARPTTHYYVVMGDGECQEGTTWETAMIANHYKVNNLTLIVDNNKQQCLGLTDKIVDVGDLGEKFKAFGWTVLNADGHNEKELRGCLNYKTNKPKAIIAHTLKGKGLKYEGECGYHVYIPKYGDLIHD